MSPALKKATLHSAIISLTMALFSYSCFSRLDRTAVNTDTSAQKAPPGVSIDYIKVSGMNYMIVSTTMGVTLANVTKDSFEVILRKRNEIYLDIANRQSKQK